MIRPILLNDPVHLAIIGATEIGAVALQHLIGRVVTVEATAGDGILKAVVTDDPEAGHGKRRGQKAGPTQTPQQGRHGSVAILGQARQT